MTKKYKINGKEIEGLPEELPPNFHITQYGIAKPFNDLLEALSDKEKTNGCIHQPEEHYNCADCARVEPKQEEKDTNSQVSKHLQKDVYKQEVCQKCPRYPNALVGMLDKDGNCNRCTPKQSTSLKEDLEYILDTYYSGTRSMDNARDGILKLIQSHLVKEIKQHNTPGEYIYTEDIIKIINNI